MDWRKWIIERLPEKLRVTGMIAGVHGANAADQDAV